MSAPNTFSWPFLRQTDGVAAQVLENLNVNLKDIRKEVLKELETFNLQLPPMGMNPSAPPPPPAGPSGKTARQRGISDRR